MIKWDLNILKDELEMKNKSTDIQKNVLTSMKKKFMAIGHHQTILNKA